MYVYAIFNKIIIHPHRITTHNTSHTKIDEKNRNGWLGTISYFKNPHTYNNTNHSTA